MERNQGIVKGFIIALLAMFISTVNMASARESHRNHPSRESSSLEEVAQVPGSKIVFQEDSFDFGQIPYSRKVAHIFHFQNAGTSPLLIAQHLKSKPIEGC